MQAMRVCDAGKAAKSIVETTETSDLINNAVGLRHDWWAVRVVVQ